MVALPLPQGLEVRMVVSCFSDGFSCLFVDPVRALNEHCPLLRCAGR